jgi:hypothetical protein
MTKTKTPRKKYVEQLPPDGTGFDYMACQTGRPTRFFKTKKGAERFLESQS